MPALKVNDVGTWRTIRKVFVNDAGTWRPIRKIFVNDAGTWRNVFTALSTTSTGQSAFAQTLGGSPKAVLNFNNDGTTSITGSTGTSTGGTTSSWLIDGTAAEVEVLFSGSVTTGTGTFTGTLGTYMALSTSRTIQFQATNNDATWDGTATFREIATGTVLSSIAIQLQAFGSP